MNYVNKLYYSIIFTMNWIKSKFSSNQVMRSSDTLEKEGNCAEAIDYRYIIEKQNKQINDLMSEFTHQRLKKDYFSCVQKGIMIDIKKEVKIKMEENRENHYYKYLVFSGGGVKGASFCGALEVLEELGIIYDEYGNIKLDGIAGTSAGSIIAAVLSLGYTSGEIKEIFYSLDTDKLFDRKWGIFRNVYSLLRNYGIAPGDYFDEFISELIENKTGNKNYTIQDLYDDKGISLVVVGTDLNNLNSIYFYPNNEEEPKNSNITIREAVRISMGIPYIFVPEIHNGNMCVDGGLLDNFPIHVFDGDYPGDIKARLNLIEPNHDVLGINLMTTDNIHKYDYINRQEITSFTDFSMLLIDTLLTENQRRILTPSFWTRTINIVTPQYPLSNFQLTNKNKDDLIDYGKKFTRKFFDIEE